MYLYIFFSALSLLCVIVKLQVASGAKHGKTSSTNFEYREQNHFHQLWSFHHVQYFTSFLLQDKITTAVNLTLFTDSFPLQSFQTITVSWIPNIRLFSNRAALNQFILNYTKLLRCVHNYSQFQYQLCNVKYFWCLNIVPVNQFKSHRSNPQIVSRV